MSMESLCVDAVQRLRQDLTVRLEAIETDVMFTAESLATAAIFRSVALPSLPYGLLFQIPVVESPTFTNVPQLALNSDGSSVGDLWARWCLSLSRAVSRKALVGVASLSAMLPYLVLHRLESLMQSVQDESLDALIDSTIVEVVGLLPALTGNPLLPPESLLRHVYELGVACLVLVRQEEVRGVPYALNLLWRLILSSLKVSMRSKELHRSLAQNVKSVCLDLIKEGIDDDGFLRFVITRLLNAQRYMGSMRLSLKELWTVPILRLMRNRPTFVSVPRLELLLASALEESVSWPELLSRVGPLEPSDVQAARAVYATALCRSSSLPVVALAIHNGFTEASVVSRFVDILAIHPNACRALTPSLLRLAASTELPNAMAHLVTIQNPLPGHLTVFRTLLYLTLSHSLAPADAGTAQVSDFYGPPANHALMCQLQETMSPAFRDEYLSFLHCTLDTLSKSLDDISCLGGLWRRSLDVPTDASRLPSAEACVVVPVSFHPSPTIVKRTEAILRSLLELSAVQCELEQPVSWTEIPLTCLLLKIATALVAGGASQVVQRSWDDLKACSEHYLTSPVFRSACPDASPRLRALLTTLFAASPDLPRWALNNQCA